MSVTLSPKFVLLLLLVFIAIELISANPKYCALNRDHVLCKYKPGVVAPACGGKIGKQKIDKAAKAAILKAHNDARRKVAKGLEKRGNPGPQPSAANMRELVWDDELATIAQTWTNQCIFDIHNPVTIDLSNSGIGENRWDGGRFDLTTAFDYAAPILDSWVGNEVKLMKPGNAGGTVQRNGEVGHYTQVVWAETARVGCGALVYTWKENQKPYSILTCNYGPAGNFPSRAVYKIGKAGSACPKGTTNSDGLCALTAG